MKMLPGMTESIEEFPEEIKQGFIEVLQAAENLSEAIVSYDYRTSEAPIFGALDQIAGHIKNGDHD